MLVSLFEYEYERVDGTGRVVEVRRTEYWRSHRRRTISGVGDGLIPASRTWEEPRERREISCWDRGDEDDEMNDSAVRLMRES
jgi:hypothetical protein